MCSLSNIEFPSKQFSAENDVPTNILRLSEAISKEDDNGVQQVIMYDAGVGTSGRFDTLRGGILGKGLDLNVLQLYTFLSMNYDDHDEVYLFGFSRGAYTVRSLAGMIYHCGLVRREHLNYVREAYEMYRNRDGIALEKFRASYGRRISIKVLGCFDTVGALGIPDRIFGVKVPRWFKREYQFHDTTLNENIEHAVHILSIDENRLAYSPTEMNETHKGQVTRAYFWGSHSGVGGGKKSEAVASNITLFYLLTMLKRFKCGLQFSEDMIPKSYEEVAREVVVQSNSFISKVIRLVSGRAERAIDPQFVHWTAIRRLQEVETWRPGALVPFEKQLSHIDWTALENEEATIADDNSMAVLT